MSSLAMPLTMAEALEIASGRKPATQEVYLEATRVYYRYYEADRNAERRAAELRNTLIVYNINQALDPNTPKIYNAMSYADDQSTATLVEWLNSKSALASSEKMKTGFLGYEMNVIKVGDYDGRLCAGQIIYQLTIEPWNVVAEGIRQITGGRWEVPTGPSPFSPRMGG